MVTLFDMTRPCVLHRLGEGYVHAYRHRAVHERHHLERVRNAVESEAACPDGGTSERRSAERDAIKRVGERCTYVQMQRAFSEFRQYTL